MNFTALHSRGREDRAPGRLAASGRCLSNKSDLNNPEDGRGTGAAAEALTGSRCYREGTAGGLGCRAASHCSADPVLGAQRPQEQGIPAPGARSPLPAELQQGPLNPPVWATGSGEPRNSQNDVPLTNDGVSRGESPGRRTERTASGAGQRPVGAFPRRRVRHASCGTQSERKAENPRTAASEWKEARGPMQWRARRPTKRIPADSRKSVVRGPEAGPQGRWPPSL